VRGRERDGQPRRQLSHALHLHGREHREVHVGAVQRQPALGAGEVEQVGHEPRCAPGLAHQQPGPALAAFGVGGCDEHRLGERLHPGQGGAQLVGGVGEETAQFVCGAPGARLRVLERVQGVVERGGGPAGPGPGMCPPPPPPGGPAAAPPEGGVAPAAPPQQGGAAPAPAPAPAPGVAPAPAT
jgi:hypothetical protein